MQKLPTHFATFSLSSSRLAQVVRKPVRRSRRRKVRGLPIRGAIVPMPKPSSRQRAPRTVSAVPGVAASGTREEEWVRSHWREYAGRWVVLDGGRLVGEAAGARDALEKARAAGVVSPFLVHVTELSDLPFGGW